MSYWILPQFLVGVLGAGSMAFGRIEGAAETVASFGRLVSGSLSDRWRRRKPLAAMGYTLANGGQAAARAGPVVAASFLDSLLRSGSQGRSRGASRCSDCRLGTRRAAWGGVRIPPGDGLGRRDGRTAYHLPPTLLVSRRREKGLLGGERPGAIQYTAGLAGGAGDPTRQLRGRSSQGERHGGPARPKSRAPCTSRRRRGVFSRQFLRPLPRPARRTWESRRN